MRLPGVLFLLALAVDAQVVVDGRRVMSPPPQAAAPSATPAADLASVEGRVINAVTGEPVRKASIVLRATGVSRVVGYSAVADAAGNFVIKGVEPGRYRLSASRTGFVPAQYGSRDPGRPGNPVSLERAQTLKEINLRLTPQGVVSGRIVDEDGDPLGQVQVQLWTLRYQQGRKQLAPVNGAATNDLGEYRLYGLAPCKCYLSATLRPAAGPQTGADSPEDYVPTYYPGTTDVSAAVALEVTAGGELRGADLRLAKAHTVRIRGRVTYAAPPGQRARAMVTLVPRGPVAVNYPVSQTDGDGKFEIRSALPGTYQIVAYLNQNGKFLAVRQPINVGAGDIEDMTLTLAPGVDIEGRVRAEGDSQVNWSSMRLTPQARESGANLFPSNAVNVKEDGTFKLGGVSPDRYDLVFSGVPETYFVKAIRFGGADVPASGLELGSAAPAPLEVVLSPDGGRVTGTVQNPKTQQPASAATVVFVPQERERRDLQRYYKIGTADQSGNFTFQGIVPGEYKAYAWEEIEPGAYIDPDFMTPFESRGEPVSVQERGQQSLQLSLITGEMAR